MEQHDPRRSGWVEYGPGEKVKCPGVARAGTGHRDGCRRTLLQVEEGTRAFVRMARMALGRRPERPRVTLVCDRCRRPVEVEIAPDHRVQPARLPGDAHG